MGNPFTISAGTATFAFGIPDRIGVGDAIEYDTNGDGVFDSLAFVRERISLTELTLTNQLGDAPAVAGVTERWAIFRAYTSLSDAADGITNPVITLPFDNAGNAHDLTALGMPMHIACYGDAVDTAQVQFTGWTTSATAYLRVFTPVQPWEVGVSQRHRGVIDASKYTLAPPATSGNRALNVVDAFVRVEGLQVFIDADNMAGDLPYGIDIGSDTAPRVAYIHDNIVHGNGMTTPNSSIQRGIKFGGLATGQTIYVYNNIVYDFGAMARGVELVGNGTTAYLYNNTFVHVFPAFMGNSTADAIIAKNNVAIACGGQCVDGVSSFVGTNNIGNDFAGVGIGVSPSADTIAGHFVADGDFHLAGGANELVDSGLDVSADPNLAFDHDIDGELRSAPWDIGADER